MLISFDVLQPRSWLPYCMQGEQWGLCLGKRPQWGSETLLCAVSLQSSRQKQRLFWRAFLRGLDEQEWGCPCIPGIANMTKAYRYALVWVCPPANWGQDLPEPHRELNLLENSCPEATKAPSFPSSWRSRQRHMKQLLKKRWNGSASYLKKIHCHQFLLWISVLCFSTKSASKRLCGCSSLLSLKLLSHG